MNKLLIILVFFSSGLLFATPEISLWTNNQCSKCHINMQGGGQRNAFGKNFGKNTSVISSLSTDITNNSIIAEIIKRLNWIEIPYSYHIAKTEQKPDSLFFYGFDSRLQSARSHKSETTSRKFFPMQGSVYIGSIPFNWLTLEGQYNFGPKIFQGQREWSSSAIFNFGKELPKLRAGFFQPSIGIKDCDMTSLDRRVPFPDGSEIIISPDFAEIGAELIYEPNEWLTVNGGLFDSRSLNEVLVGNHQSIVSVPHNPTITSRIAIYPSWIIDDFYDSYFGASFLVNGNFKYFSAFAGIAPLPEIHFYFKYNYSNKPNTMPYQRTTNTLIAGTNFIPTKGIILGLRAETGSSDWLYPNSKYTINTTQAIINAKVLLFPFFEIMPEYRYLKTQEFESYRWAIQIHFYY